VIYAPQSSPGSGRLPACVTLLWLLFTFPLLGQHRTEISSDTRLRKEPDGIGLVSLSAGTSVETRTARGAWHEVVIEGWIFSQSTAPTRRDGYDLVVTPSEGENIRREPNGEVFGRARSGALFHKLDTRGGWTHVNRLGWIPREAIAPIESGAISPEVSADTPLVQGPTVPPASTSPPQPAPSKAAAEPDRVEAARETAVFAAPGAPQLGTVQAGTPTRILGRSGEWVRVQLEGWVRAGDLQSASGAAVTGVTAAEVRSDPSRYLGRAVAWRLQLIAVQTADELRTEMPKGQNYLLTRGPLPEPGFVYVTVSDAQAAEFRAAPALQEMTLRVTIKAARSKYLATPIVEYVSRVAE
jgi:SH3 domain-containing protein